MSRAIAQRGTNSITRVTPPINLIKRGPSSQRNRVLSRYVLARIGVCPVTISFFFFSNHSANRSPSCFDNSVESSFTKGWGPRATSNPPERDQCLPWDHLDAENCTLRAAGGFRRAYFHRLRRVLAPGLSRGPAAKAGPHARLP